jgi:hypothetical protein
MKNHKKMFRFLAPALTVLLLLGTVGHLKADMPEDGTMTLPDGTELVDLIAVFPFESDTEATDMKYFTGEITKVKDCYVHFKHTDGTRSRIPGNAIGAYYMSDLSPKGEEMDMALRTMILDPTRSCQAGTSDADLYHKRFAGNFAGGMLLGVFWVIGAAVSNPSPMRGQQTMMMSDNKDLFTNPYYLNCYKKKARSKNVIAALAGWGTWILLVAIAGSGG